MGTEEIRISVSPYLTRTEIRDLRAKAAAHLRSVPNYVSSLVLQDLQRKRSVARSNPLGQLDDKRAPFYTSVQVTAVETRKLQAKARAERRSLSNYVAKLIVEALRRG